MSVEFAVVLPAVAIVLLCVAQVGVTVAEVLTLTHAAREGARTFAVTADPDRAVESAVLAGNLDRGRAAVSATRTADGAQVEIAARTRVFPGLPLPEVTLRARAVMRFERAPS